MAERQHLRCAIYTRKSTEYGLEQEFNSLDAQREAAEAYIKSQAHDGWRCLPQHYDDGGISGGSLDRPALQSLLAEVRERKIDIVVVYKVDRLTRSLADFAKLVELFDTHGVSFVSVTQQFNTTTSMGRLTLNVLLSFAQFEREVTGERIRDKIAASKRKGLWMGGPVPLGYAAQDRKLVIVEDEADQVRFIFRRYLELDGLAALQEDLKARRIVTKISKLGSGSIRGGIPFYKGGLAYLLKNRTYLGEIVHQKQFYPGQHPSILDQDLFDAVQAQLAAKAQCYKRARFGSASLLIGRIFDDAGNRMTPTTAQKRGARYRYYVSSPSQHGGKAKPGLTRRIPAPDAEAVVLGALRKLWREQNRCATSAMLDEALAPDDRELIHRFLTRAIVGDKWIKVVLLSTLNANPTSSKVAHEHLGDVTGDLTVPESINLPFIIRNTRPRREVISAAGEPSDVSRPMRADTHKTLLVAIAKARAWAADLIGGRVADTNEIARREDRSERHIRMMLPLAFLAPDIVSAAIARSLPPDLGVSRFIDKLPMSWPEQRKQLGLVQVGGAAG